MYVYIYINCVFTLPRLQDEDQDGSNIDARLAEDKPGKAPRWRKMAQDSPKMAPSWPQYVATSLITAQPSFDHR